MPTDVGDEPKAQTAQSAVRAFSSFMRKHVAKHINIIF